LAELARMNKILPPGVLRMGPGCSIRYPAETPARRLNFDKIEREIKPEDKELKSTELVQIKRKKVDEREAKDPESYIAAEAGQVPGEGEKDGLSAEPVVTEQPIDLTVDVHASDEVGIVLSSPTSTPTIVVTRSQSAPATAPTWSLLKSDNPTADPISPENVIVSTDLVASDSNTEVEVEVDATPPASPEVDQIIDVSAAQITTPEMDPGILYTDSPAELPPGFSYVSGGPTGPVNHFGDIHQMNSTDWRILHGLPIEKEVIFGNQAHRSGAESSGKVGVLVVPPHSAIPTGDPKGVVSDPTTRTDKADEAVNGEDSDGETIQGDPNPSTAVEIVKSTLKVPTDLRQSPDAETPPDQDLVTPLDNPVPSFPKQSYPKSPSHQPDTRPFVSSFRTASVSVPSPLATTTTAGQEDDQDQDQDQDQLVPTRQNTPDSDTTHTQSQVITLSPLVRRIESADSSMDIGMPAEVDLANPMSVKNIKMDRAYTLYFTKSTAKDASSPTSNGNVHGKVYPQLGIVDVKQYTGGLVPIFTAYTFGDFFGSWMALRRQIAEVVQRPIEPPHMGLLAPGTEGLGLHLFQSDKTAHFFIKDVRPAWEDPMCKGGGKIVLLSHPAEVCFPSSVWI
jgi:hypothetical protein